MSNSARGRKILVIGIDGGCWSVLNRAIEAGAMPVLKEMMDQGGAGPLLSTIPPKTPAAWGTFQTGKNPGANGVFDFAWWDRSTHKSMYVSSASLQDTIWDLAGREGKRVGIVNVPMTYPPRMVEGKMVTGLLTPSLESEWTYPPSLKHELLQAVPGYHIFNIKNIGPKRVHKNLPDFLDQMAEILENRARAAVFLMEQDSFDFFMVHFQASDVVQHALWGYMSQDHPDYDASLCKMIFRRFYTKLDEKIRDIREVFRRFAGGPFLTVVLSDHGFQTHFKRVNLGWWLRQEGFLKTRRISIRKRIEHKIKQFRRTQNSLRAEVLWDQTSVYSFSRGNCGFLYFLENDPEKRKEIQRRLRHLLESLTDPETGRPIVKKIHPRDSIYQGVYIDRMPDWVIDPTDGYSFTGDYLPGQKKLIEPVCRQTDFHVGMHHQEGILVVCGPGVKHNQPITGARILDLAPTLLAGLGLTIPNEMEGRILQELFTETLNEQMSHSQKSPSAIDTKTASVYSKEDLDKIQQRLRDLGYIE